MLCRKVGDKAELVETVRGVGYRIDEVAAGARADAISAP
jgi:hypothetical protein